MHPNKAKILAQSTETADRSAETIRRNLRVVASPHEHALVQVGAALLTLPLLAVSVILGDLSSVMISRTDDDEWNRLPPLDLPSD